MTTITSPVASPTVYVLEWGNGNVDVFADQSDAVACYVADQNPNDEPGESPLDYARDGGQQMSVEQAREFGTGSHIQWSEEAKAKIAVGTCAYCKAQVLLNSDAPTLQFHNWPGTDTPCAGGDEHPVTAENLPSVTVTGLGADHYTESGNYGSGFWHNELRVDLEELAAGRYDEAFAVIADVHDTAGVSMDEYHGIEYSAKLPNGVSSEAIQEFCDRLAANEKLTKGFSAEWDGSNRVGKWYDEDGDQVSAEQVESCTGPDYWENCFQDEVRDLDATEVYDLSFSENIPFVLDGLSDPSNREQYDQLASEKDVLAMLHNLYEDGPDTIFIEYEDAAARLWEYIQEERAETE